MWLYALTSFGTALVCLGLMLASIRRERRAASFQQWDAVVTRLTPDLKRFAARVANAGVTTEDATRALAALQASLTPLRTAGARRAVAVECIEAREPAGTGGIHHPTLSGGELRR